MRLLNQVYRARPTAMVYQLRRDGNIDQAYQCARALYAQSVNDEDVKKAYAWTLIDLCKRDIQNDNMQSAHERCAELSSLGFEGACDDFSLNIMKQIRALRSKLDPNSDKIKRAIELSKGGSNNEAYEIMASIANAGGLAADFHENYGWVIYRYLRDNINDLSSAQVRSRLRDYMNLQNERPSLLHSQILNFALNFSRMNPDFRLISFLKLWGPENLTMADFQESCGQDGKKIPSLMHRIAREVVRFPHDDVAELIDILPFGKVEFVNLLRVHCFWNIWRFMSDGQTQDAMQLFDAYAEEYSQYGPSEVHSKILDFAERTMKDDPYRFYSFFKKWNPANLRPEDWCGEKNDVGGTYKPLALKAIKRASDGLDVCGGRENDFSWLIDSYRVAVEKVPEDEWTLRAMAMLLHRAGDIDEVADIYRKLVLDLGDKYYIWGEFAGCVTDVNVKVGMLCKAVLVEKNEDFLGQIRLDLAEQFLGLGLNEAAALEIKLYQDCYNAKGWSIKARFYELESRCGNVTVLPEDNKQLYEKYAGYAEDYAYADIPFVDYVLVSEWVNEEGKKLNKYVSCDGDEVVFKPGRFKQLKKAKPGQVWSMKMYHADLLKSIPVVIKRSDLPDWSVLPVGYGYVNHVNEEKCVYHIYSQDSDLIYVNYRQKEFSKGDFVSYRSYSRTVGGKKKVEAYAVTLCDSELALEGFMSSVVAVDGVNDDKRLFHYVMGDLRHSGVIHYDMTDLRPEVGDFLKIRYYVRERKNLKPGESRSVVEILKIEETSEKDVRLVREFTGSLKVKFYDEMKDLGCCNDEDDDWVSREPDFAFIGDYYVHKSILEKFGVTENCYVKAKAVRASDNKWKVFWINEEECGSFN